MICSISWAAREGEETQGDGGQQPTAMVSRLHRLFPIRARACMILHSSRNQLTLPFGNHTSASTPSRWRAYIHNGPPARPPARMRMCKSTGQAHRSCPFGRLQPGKTHLDALDNGLPTKGTELGDQGVECAIFRAISACRLASRLPRGSQRRLAPQKLLRAQTLAVPLCQKLHTTGYTGHHA
jgi:hypothetical protein